MIKILFFDMGYTLVDEGAVWQKRCAEQAKTEDAKRLGLSANAIYQEIEKASVARLPQYRTIIKNFGSRQSPPIGMSLKCFMKTLQMSLKRFRENTNSESLQTKQMVYVSG